MANADSVADWEAANRIIQAAMDAYGRIDCIINNAGILRDRFFFNMSVEEWKAVIDVHLNGSFYVARAAASHFRSENRGCYIHMTSTSGLVGNLGQANYAAAKLGIAALSKSIAMDMARYKVRSNCIAPFAWSRMIGSIPTETNDQKARVEKLKRMETAKIAPLAVYLASDAAAESLMRRRRLIMVPPVGDGFSLSGSVRRPASYRKNRSRAPRADGRRDWPGSPVRLHGPENRTRRTWRAGPRRL